MQYHRRDVSGVLLCLIGITFGKYLTSGETRFFNIVHREKRKYQKTLLCNSLRTFEFKCKDNYWGKAHSDSGLERLLAKYTSP